MCSFFGSPTGQSGDPAIDATVFVSKITGILAENDGGWNRCKDRIHSNPFIVGVIHGAFLNSLLG